MESLKNPWTLFRRISFGAEEKLVKELLTYWHDDKYSDKLKPYKIIIEKMPWAEDHKKPRGKNEKV
ncbi:hypothetical protein ES703_70112 [subsurface metagenome]